MKHTLSNILVFAAGAAIGSVVTWKLIEAKYAQIAQDEIESVKEEFACRYEREETEDVDEDARPKMTPTKPDIHEYAATLKSEGYTNYSNSKSTNAREEVDNVDDIGTKPYVIAPESFGELEDYETISLTYYDDGVLTDDRDEPVEDVEDVVGLDFPIHFGEYEDDSVFIRNERLKADYEILLDSRKYSDVINSNPHLAEDE